MDCRAAREGLWPPENPRLATDEVVGARRHVSECPECRDYFEQDRALLELYDRLRHRKAPPELRSRIYDALARERTARSTGDEGDDPPGAGTTPSWTDRAHPWLRRAAAGLATVLLVAGSLLWSGHSHPVETDRSLFVEDYLRRAVSQERIETSSPVEVAEFFQRELGLVLTPLRLPGGRLTGAEICLLEGRRGAMILYRADGATLSHYVVPTGDARRRGPAPAPPVEGRARSDVGPAVVTWASGSLQHALVGPLPPDRLLALARQATSM